MIGQADIDDITFCCRPGGRIYTKKFGDTPVDLGAAWIQGACTGNPVFSLACQDEAIQSPMVRAKRYHGFCFDSNGSLIKNKIVNAAIQLFDEINSTGKKRYTTMPEEFDLWSYFSKQITYCVDLFPPTDKAAAEKVLYGMTNEVRHIVGTPLECVPLARYGRRKSYPGGVVAVQSGMSRILNPLLRVITGNRIKYNKAAVKIYWKNEIPSKPRVMVVTDDGGKEEADYVIVAMPLGVLKEAVDHMFVPPLPEEKLDAIRALGVGNNATIVAQYAKPFWIKGEGYIRLCWNKQELTERKHWTNSVDKVEEIPTTEDMLHISVSGPEAVQIECLTDCELARDITGLLRRFLGNHTIPMPSAVYKSTWKNNTFIRGANTYLAMGSHETDVSKLAQPLPKIGVEKAPALLFAGEHCSTKESGLVAARLTGIAEAERILYFTKCFCGPPPPSHTGSFECL